MNYVDRALDFLQSQENWRYNARTSAAAEPTALAAVALGAHGRTADAERACAWLSAAQVADGSVPVRAGEKSSPGWSTPLALLAWNLPTPHSAAREASRRAVAWLLQIVGETAERPLYTQHDTTIAGWPWVDGTHSWIEPTAMSVLALRAVGLNDHPRTRDGVRMLVDRLLPSGGCNYGNTIVLDQVLLPHVEPTGAALVALAGEEDTSHGRIEASLAYLEQSLDAATAPASLGYAFLGLAAFDRTPPAFESLISAALPRSMRRGASHEVALLALAALGAECPLFTLHRVPAAL